MLKIRTIPLSKQSPGVTSPWGKIRPVSILSLIAKILECYSFLSISKYLYEKTSFRNTGYLKGLSCETNMMNLQKWFSEWKQKKRENPKVERKATLVSIDGSSAFNCLSHESMSEQLKKAVSEPEHDLLMTLMKRVECVIGGQTNGVF